MLASHVVDCRVHHVMASCAWVTYSVDLAGYDTDTAGAMLPTGPFPYVGFMCHRVAEKTVKAWFY